MRQLRKNRLKSFCSKTAICLSISATFYSPAIRLSVNSDGESHLPCRWFEILSRLILYSPFTRYLLNTNQNRMNDYMALKMFSHDMLPREESTYYDKINQGNQQHLGSGRVRTKIAEFEFTRLEIFKHLAILQEPLGESLLDIQNRSVGERLDKLSIQSTIYQMLLALDYMHTECILIHGGMEWPPT